jgi:hypothetical protein
MGGCLSSYLSRSFRALRHPTSHLHRWPEPLRSKLLTRPPRPAQRVPARIESHWCSPPRCSFLTSQRQNRTPLRHLSETPRHTPCSHARVVSHERANEILKVEIKRQNSTRNSSTGEVPNNLFEQSQPHSATRPSPPTALLDLHLSLRTTRKVAPDHSMEFEGRT